VAKYWCDILPQSSFFVILQFEMMKKRLLFLLWYVLNTSALLAQTADEQLRGIYERAEMSYGIGRIEEAQELLNGSIKLFSGSLRQSAYRLLSLCSLSLDDEAAAENYVRLLLLDNPYYSTTLDDPQRFTDMVERISGRGESTITTASSHEESLSEVPVPTTLITEQMIRDSGARNLQEVLAAYVPGMSIVDCNDDINIAMRGIFSSGQEKILIMLNGHRLNSYTTNTAAPDFSLSLEKLKQIEVLRGPASSLYGGVALTAVVNLITKKGADVDGIKARAGYGDHGQLKADVLFGKRYYDLDLLLWGSFYDADGEDRDMPVTDGTYATDRRKVTVGATAEMPSYDLGMSLKWRDLQLMYDVHVSELRSPYTISTLASPYDYDRYRTYYGMRPCVSATSHHADVKYGRQIGKVAIDGTFFIDNHDLTHYQVISDDTLAWFGNLLELDESLSQLFSNHGGTSRIINGLETTYGAQVKGDYNYIATDSHSGYLTFGAEYSHFTLDDVRYTMGYDFVNNTPENHVLSEVGKGSENSYNAFAQLKHQWRSLILNAGLRYDHKVRFDDSRVNELSPRLALIYLRPKWNVKLSYSKSFVDAPYLYQKINQFMPYLQNNTTGNINKQQFEPLHPEKLHSYQLTFAGTQWLKGLDFELNFFHNKAEELIFSHILDYENGGKNETIGAEIMAGYKSGRLSANFNATWIHTRKSQIRFTEIFAYDIDHNNSTPSVMANLVAGWQATKKLRVHGKAAFQGKQKTYNVSFAALSQLYGLNELYLQAAGDDKYQMELAMQMADLIDNELVTSLYVGSRIVFDLGAEYRIGKVTLGLDIHNLLDKQYNQSGMNTGLVPQRGRWMLGTVAISL